MVAHEGGARIFLNVGPGKGIELTQEIEHPEGRLRDREVDTDRPGRAFQSKGQGRSAYERRTMPQRQFAEDFAREIAQTLKAARVEHAYTRLILVAAPRLLGLLRAALDPPTAALVTGSLDKDLAGADAAAIAEQLSVVLAV